MDKPFKQHLAVTLTHVAPKVWRSTQEITGLHQIEKGTVRAIFNRLQELREMGIVQSQRVGREQQWRRS